MGRGDMDPLGLLFVSASEVISRQSGDRVERRRKHVSTWSPLVWNSIKPFEVLRLGSEELRSTDPRISIKASLTTRINRGKEERILGGGNSAGQNGIMIISID